FMKHPFVIFIFVPILLFLVISVGCEKLDRADVSQDSSINEEETTNKVVTEQKKSTSVVKKKQVVSNLEGTQQFPTFADLVEILQPSVVNISTTSVVRQRGPFQRRPNSPFGGNDPFDDFFKKFFGGDPPQQEFKRQGLGSGFIMSKDGYVVTNNHVIDKASDVEIILQNGDKYEAKIVGKDPKTDLAVLKFEPDQEIQEVHFGDSDNLRIGDWVIAIGNPFGLGYTVTVGIVSAKGRSLGLGAYDDFIQTDASLNPGSSGGPLFNLKGEVVGVNTAIVARGQGIGFAIPIDMVEFVIEQLKSGGKVVRGWLGVYVQKVTPEIASSFGLNEDEGALVSDLAPDSPAEKAGIIRGDVIVEYDGQKVNDVSDLTNMAAVTPPGTEVSVKVIQDGKTKNMKVKLEEFPDQEAQVKDEVRKSLGLTVRQLTPKIVKRFNIDHDEGVIIADVDQGSVAGYAGLKPGDIILEINKKPINTLANYSAVLEDVKPGDTALFLVKRGNNTIYAALRIRKDDKNEGQKE
ncbi:MAG: DegQ family serine endoprotease, partial [Candidatus Dadabacteria bacterium]|nr:DegQ family serine endoprotease [Candidatus Dadabacteria bacterium]